MPDLRDDTVANTFLLKLCNIFKDTIQENGYISSARILYIYTGKNRFVKVSDYLYPGNHLMYHQWIDSKELGTECSSIAFNKIFVRALKMYKLKVFQIYTWLFGYIL